MQLVAIQAPHSAEVHEPVATEVRDEATGSMLRQRKSSHLRHALLHIWFIQVDQAGNVQ